MTIDNNISKSDIISKSLQQLKQAQNGLSIDRPSKYLAAEFTDLCFNTLFPIYSRRCKSSAEEETSFYKIDNMLTTLLIPLKTQLPDKPENICNKFISQLPEIYTSLMIDAQAICDFDPASSNLDEIIITYPGFFAIAVYRISHALRVMNVPILPRMISEYAHSQTGIDINPGAQIGKSFFIDHGTGIVIGETTIINDNVKIYQGVTLGALQVKKELASTKRHPTVEDNVIIYSNATILGGETVIGRNSIIGGNVWITESVPPDSMVYHVKEIRIRQKK